MAPLSDEARRLVEQYGGLAVWFARHNLAWVSRRLAHQDRQDVLEDLIGSARLALCEAAGRSAEAHDFRAFAIHIMKVRLVDYVRKQTKLPTFAPLPSSHQEARWRTSMVEREAIGRALTQAAFAQLPERQAQALRLRLAGYDRVEMAERIGCSPVQAENAASNARRSLMVWWKRP